MTRNYEMADGSWDMDRESADELQASLEAQAQRSERLARKGICTHGWRQFIRERGVDICQHCGAEVNDERTAFSRSL